MQGTAGPVVHPVLDTDRVNNGFFAAKKSDAGKVWRGLQAESVHFAQRCVQPTQRRATEGQIGLFFQLIAQNVEHFTIIGQRVPVKIGAYDVGLFRLAGGKVMVKAQGRAD